LATLAAGFGVALAISVALVKPNLGGRPMGYVVVLALAWATVAAAASWLAVSRGRSMLGRPVAHRVATAVLTPMALLGASVLANLGWPQTMDGRGGPIAGLVCAALIIVFAFGPLLAFGALRRGSDPVGPGIGGAALGAAAGAWGALGIELHCKFATPSHVMLGHVLPVALLALAGALVGGRVLRVSAVRQ
jgi:hypothetical protein